jgi:hypothetical protein
MLRHGTVGLRQRGQRSLGRGRAWLGAGFGGGFGLLAWLLGAPGAAAGQSGIEGVDGWAEAVVGRSTSKWAGQRVEFPLASPRPATLGRLDSLSIPLSVHVTAGAQAERAREVLRNAEAAYALLAGAGLFAAHGDGGQAGTWNRDLYLVDAAPEQDGTAPPSGARLDATEPAFGVDGARAFALLDARVPSARLLACTAQALVEAELYELDPAEAAVVREGSAAYFAWLATGESCAGETDLVQTRTRGLLRDPAAFFAFLRALGARMDHNQGGFVQSMWHFARQRTWEGTGLRGSPDLLEAIARRFELEHTKLEEVAGELANWRALERPGEALESAPRVAFGALPAHLPPSPALGPLDSAFLLIDLEQPRPGQQLRVWSRGEVGPRWVLTATRLDALGSALSSVNAPVRKYPESELHMELDARTRFVLVSITNLAGGVPDPDLPPGLLDHSARLIVDTRH